MVDKYSLTVPRLGPEKMGQLEEMLPPHGFARGIDTLEVIYYFEELSPRDMQKITKIVTTLNPPYWLFEKRKH